MNKFDIRKFLTENKLTEQSKQLDEAFTEQGLEKLMEEISDLLYKVGSECDCRLYNEIKAMQYRIDKHLRK